MPRKLVIAGIAITGIGLALLGYLDPVVRILFFGQAGVGTLGGSTAFTRTGTFAGNFTGIAGQLGRGGGAASTSLISAATILVFVVTVIGLLLTIAGSFATGKSGGLGLPGRGVRPGDSADSGPATVRARDRMRIVIS